MKYIISTFLISLSISAFSQKKILDHADVDLWKTIKNRSISNDGNFVMYSLEKGEKDSHLKIKNAKSNLVFEHERGEKGKFTYHSDFALFTIKAWKDSVSDMKRRKVKKDRLPKDSLGIYNLNDGSLVKIGNIKSYKVPEKWSSHIAYQLEEISAKKDTTKNSDKEIEKEEKKDKKKKKSKKVDKDNGYHLVVRNLLSKKEDTIKFVTDYIFAKEGRQLSFVTTGTDSIMKAGVYVFDFENDQLSQVYEAEKSKYYQLSFSESGERLGFVVDNDTTKAYVRPNELFLWQKGASLAEKLLDGVSSPKGYRVSPDGAIIFSKDETKVYFGLATPAIVQDTLLNDDEIVNVEVWTYDEPRLYTVQELQLKRDQEKAYETVIHLKDGKLVQLGSKEYPNVRLGNEGNAPYALVNNPKPYQLESQWTGMRSSDYALVNVATGETKKVLTALGGAVRLSPEGKYAYGYSPVDSTWFAYGVASGKRIDLTKGKLFYNELNDSPRHPSSYSVAGWTEKDKALLIYDRYDIWKFDPDTGSSEKLTEGRANKVTYRYVQLDDEKRFMDTNEKWLFTTFDETSKHSGYYEYNPKTTKGKQLVSGPYSYSRPIKAQMGEHVIFTRQSFQEFPNIRISNLNFKKQIVVSDANPQQKEYNWGTSELVKWTSLDGKELTGMLIKPENFDPNKKYPMIVNFYEKSSNGLFRHRAPSFGRSTINYSFYTSRGYLIFNPDVHYRIGYPGESALNCVIPGITSLLEKGFVDKDNIGVQGHSWGGYQIAYLVTKTDIFKAAESGAPVPNMISAYGGIRWGTGLSRQFQYEHTQSRLGGTPWEYPARYIENSPIFNIDKINTPLLVMHNDADGHVPWYQGIEFFVSLRRLGKPSWFLNYNGEPHWPLKFQNRKDFNLRMAQFFDHYLKAAPKPVWMKHGVPAIEKGINQGYELLDDIGEN
ncbi:dipeptidyl aminopeptidase/acylaminoacyl peptidase [Saonia flava]|uniref:Dipeptidyl aminopeptidase/acylaminoacyl peptidase n=1 Tax=Saonia flava TaxID=523696 RepID=A0A846QPH2_9FLAO|nr:prolyl oligopeptidase family serine peptidase [Saonia flava]NJB69951.1 dipeptidyl aminopeptidase/acylaminoacyl peptidase [Saonia flava]